MKKFFLLFSAITFLYFSSNAQSKANNGQLDDFSEFCSKYTIPLVMPDGTKLFTDMYVARTRDSLSVNLLGATIEFIPKGAQLLYYDTLNGQPNPNPYQLPTVFTRTPYNKGNPDEYDPAGSILAIMGYNYMLQDMRGRYSSGGVYFPMYSDSWNKNGYHPLNGHILDAYPISDPRHSNRHEDGYNSIKAIAQIDSAYIVQWGDAKTIAEVANYYKGLPHTNTRLNNGSIGMFGASALGNTQLQLGAAHRILDSIPELKCLFPIVATIEHYLSTGYNGGVFRNRIVTGWLKGQIFTGTDDDLNAADEASGPGFRDNTIHSSADYNLPQPYTVNRVTRIAQKNKFEAANISIDHFSTVRYPWYKQPSYTTDPMSPSGFYPNSIGRADMDASAAPVDAQGESVDGATQLPRPNLTYSRYTNLQVPVFHLTGWWDIFTGGQINTLNYTRSLGLDSFKNLQKIVIGPWAHQTVGSTTTGDRTNNSNVNDITKIDLGNVNLSGGLPLGKLVTSDIITWFRYNLNYNTDKVIGEPKFIIKAGTRWQDFSFGKQIRVPAYDYVIPFEKMLNFLAGLDSLEQVTYALRNGPTDTNYVYAVVPLPLTLGTGGTGLNITDPIPPGGIPKKDFHNVPTFRMYIPGPSDSLDKLAGVVGNDKVGNYWYESDVFPVTDKIKHRKMFLHQDGSFNHTAPVIDEGTRMYIHDPNDPILTVGGSNMIVKSPNGERTSQGQMEWTDPTNAPFTMDREGVIKFTSEPIKDSLTILGYPRVNLFAKTNPAGALPGDSTDTDWNVRIGDQFPDGRIYFVNEGACNARARDYVKAINDLDESEDDKHIPYTNVASGEIYNYDFNMLPIGYCWGKGHKVVVLISSSNFTRYQVNPNLPLNPGEFFRRNPGDGQTYIYNGVEMSPRVAIQRVHFSPENPTSIEFPVLDAATNVGIKEIPKLNFDAKLFPNPAQSQVNIYVNMPSEYEVVISNSLGQTIETHRFDDNIDINLTNYNGGLYFATVKDLKDPSRMVVKKFIKN